MKQEHDPIGLLIHYIGIFGPISLTCISLFFIYLYGLYGYVYLPNSSIAIIHSISLLSLSTSFLAYYVIMSYLYPLTRLIVSFAMTILGIHTYDFIWSIFSQSTRGQGFSWGALVFILIVVALLERFDNVHGIFKLSRMWSGRKLALVILYSIFLLSFKGLVDTGFYQAMTLYSKGIGTDPNVGNLYWLIGKIMGFWLIFPLIDRNKTKAPLQLDPRVLYW